MTMNTSYEPFSSRYWGIINVEGCDPEPIALFQGQAAAARELERRKALPEDDDDHLTEYHQVFPADVLGAWWNSYDDDPPGPLSPPKIIAAFNGEPEAARG